MLSARIIPCLDIDNGRVVKGVNFINLVDAGDPIENATFYDKESADEIVFLDITATSDNRNTMFDIAKKIADTIYTPFTIGGGIRTLNDMKRFVKAGADKVSINSAAVKKPKLIQEGAKALGSQAIVVAIDAKKYNNKNFHVYIKGGRENTYIDALQWAKQCEELGAGEILLTSMDRDGTKIGYDIELTKLIAENVNIPVIASGGVGNLKHILEGFTLANASAVLAASIFHFREFSIKEVRNYLKKHKIPVRTT